MRFLTPFMGLLIAGLALVGCGEIVPNTPAGSPTGRESGTETTAANPPAADSLHGTIVVDGSSSVFPVTSAVAEEFMALHPEVNIQVAQSGTGGGFKRFAKGEIDINDASRTIKKEEAEAAQKNGIEPVMLEVGTDAITVIVSPRNTYCDCLTVEQLKKLWEPDSTVKSWKELDGKFPDAEVRLFGADNESGTFDFFTEAIVGKSKASRRDYTASARDNQLLEGVAGQEHALGYVPYSYYLENKARVKALGIKAKEGAECVVPSLESVDAGAYVPLSRPLFVCVSRKSLSRPEVKAFLKFYLTDGQKVVKEITQLNTVPANLKKSLETLEKE